MSLLRHGAHKCIIYITYITQQLVAIRLILPCHHALPRFAPVPQFHNHSTSPHTQLPRTRKGAHAPCPGPIRLGLRPAHRMADLPTALTSGPHWPFQCSDTHSPKTHAPVSSDGAYRPGSSISIACHTVYESRPNSRLNSDGSSVSLSLQQRGENRRPAALRKEVMARSSRRVLTFHVDRRRRLRSLSMRVDEPEEFRRFLI
jgi:hypothetical protein